VPGRGPVPFEGARLPATLARVGSNRAGAVICEVVTAAAAGESRLDFRPRMRPLWIALGAASSAAIVGILVASLRQDPGPEPADAAERQIASIDAGSEAEAPSRDLASPSPSTAKADPDPVENALEQPLERERTPDRDAEAAWRPRRTEDGRRLLFEGTLTLVDALGRRNTEVDASFIVSGLGMQARARRGRWRLELDSYQAGQWLRKGPRSVGIDFVHLEPDGGMLELHEPTNAFGLRDLDGVAIVVGTPRSTRRVLHVVDETTRDELAELEFAAADPKLPMRSQSHPGFCATRVVRIDAVTSPIDANLLRETRWDLAHGQCLVRASGYAWSLVPNLGAGEQEQTVALIRGGDLELSFEGVDRAPDAFIGMYQVPNPGPPIFYCPWGGLTTARVEGLRPGPSTIRLSRGPAHQSPKELARIEVEIRAGAVARAVLAAP
jgi:hypothetical protein